MRTSGCLLLRRCWRTAGSLRGGPAAAGCSPVRPPALPAAAAAAVASRYLAVFTCHPSVNPRTRPAERAGNRKRHHAGRLL